MEVTDTTPTGHPIITGELPLILLVEDNPHDVKLLHEAFRERGVVVRFITASTPIQAFSALRLMPTTALPRLILTDLGLPIMSGLEVVRGLAHDPHWRGIPIIVLTSSHRDSDGIDSLAAGAAEHLMKPTSFSGYLVLVDLLVRYLQNAQTDRLVSADRADRADRKAPRS